MKKTNRIKYLLQEIIIVVIGVVIAVSIGNYKEEIDNQNYIKKTLAAVEKEIKLSQIEVDSVLQKHNRLIESLGGTLDNDEQALGDLIGNLGGVQFPIVKNIGLRFFISNKAELVDFELISKLLEIEDQTNMLSDKMKRLADFAYQHINDTQKETKLSFAYLLTDVIDSEESLMESYKTFFEANNSSSKL
jgi:hypothetical protein